MTAARDEPETVPEKSTHWGTCARRHGGNCDCSWPGLGDMGSGHDEPRGGVGSTDAPCMSDRDDLAAMIDPHAHDTASWTLGTEANRLRRVANAQKRAEKIMTKWELKK